MTRSFIASGSRVAIVAALAAVPSLALAQSDPALVLDPITVTGIAGTATGPVEGIVAEASATGTKTDTPLIETPRSISVVTAGEIAQRGGAQTVGDALGYTAGVFSVPIATNRANWTERIRGFSTFRSTFVDGLIDPNGPGRGQPQIEPWGAERIEVLKGPASVLYGQVAPGGLINVVSKRPTFATGGEVQGQVGGYDFFQGAFDLQGVAGDGDRAAWRLVGLAQDAGTQTDFVDDDRLYVAPSLALRIDDDTSFTLLSHWRRATGAEGSGNLPRALINELPVSLNPGDPDFDRDDTTQWAVGYEFVHDFSPSVSLVQNARYMRLDVDYRQLYLADPLPELGPGWYGRTPYFLDETTTAFAIDTRLTADVTTGALSHGLLAGFDYREQETTNNTDYLYGEAPPINLFDPGYGADVVDFPRTPGETDQIENAGLYLQDQIEAGRWFATIGGRYDWATTHYDDGATYRTDTDDGALSLNAGLLYLFDNGVAPYASYAQSFWPEPGAAFDGTAFEPSRGEQFEVGVKYQPPGLDALVTLAAYDLTRTNVPTDDPEHEFYTIQTGEVRMRGVELEGRAMVGPVEAILAYTYIDSEITRSNAGDQGNEYRDVPPHTASLWLNYGFDAGPLRGATLGGGVRYWSAYWGDNANTVRNDGQTLFDLAASYDLGGLRSDWAGVTLSANVSNLTDERITVCSPWACDFGETRFASLTVAYQW